MTTNQRAISILDPIDTRISMMDDVQRADFKLRPGFNDTNPSIIERAVKKIYCTDGAGTASNARADYALEVINAIYDSPSIAVPIVLARMKQKDEDWQRAVREWNKVWREVEAKNYYRALDHQSAPFKSNDKKTLTSRSLIGEIEHLRKEHKQKRVVADSNSDLPLIPPERSQHQYELRMSDRSVIFDVMRITFAYLERVQSGFSLPERERVEGFLRLFVPLVLGVSRREIEEHFGVFEPKHADDDTDSSDEEAAGSEKDASAAEDQSTSPTVTSTTDGRKKGVKASAADLRRRLLASTVNDPAESSRQPVQDFHSKAASPDLASHQGDSDGLELGTETTWVHASSEPLPDHDLEPGKRHPSPSKESPSREPGVAAGIRRYNFFAGSSFYCLLRVFHVSCLSLPALDYATK